MDQKDIEKDLFIPGAYLAEGTHEGLADEQERQRKQKGKRPAKARIVADLIEEYLSNRGGDWRNPVQK